MTASLIYVIREYVMEKIRSPSNVEMSWALILHMENQLAFLTTFLNFSVPYRLQGVPVGGDPRKAVKNASEARNKMMRPGVVPGTCVKILVERLETLTLFFWP